MKGSTKKKVLALVTAVLFSAIVILPSVGTLRAKADTYPAARVTTANSETTEFTKFFKIRNDCDVPDVTFKFRFEAGAAKQATREDEITVYAGVLKDLKVTPVGAPTVTGGTATYFEVPLVYAAQAKANLIARQSDKTTCDNVTYVAGTEFYTAEKAIGLDFSSVVFTEPGVYRYKITESGENTIVAYDSEPVRTLDVYVEDVSEKNTTTHVDDKKLQITGYVLYVGNVQDCPVCADSAPAQAPAGYEVEDGTTATPNGLELAKKSVGYVNTYPTATLTFGKEVTGNQGSKDKYFEYTLEIEGGVAGTVMEVDLLKADASISGNPNNATTCIGASGVTQDTTITLDSDGKGSATFYLHDGQYITVKGFIQGMTYKLSEDPEEYTQTAGITAAQSTLDYDSTVDGCDALTDDADSFKTTDVKPAITGTFAPATQGGTDVKSIYTGFTNTKIGLIPTGVVLSVVPWVIAGVVIIGGVVFFAVRSKKKYDEQ